MIEIRRLRPAESKENVHVKNASENGRVDSKRAGHVGEPRGDGGTEAFTPACGASYAGQGGRSARSCGHSLDTGRV